MLKKEMRKNSGKKRLYIGYIGNQQDIPLNRQHLEAKRKKILVGGGNSILSGEEEPRLSWGNQRAKVKMRDWQSKVEPGDQETKAESGR